MAASNGRNNPDPRDSDRPLDEPAYGSKWDGHTKRLGGLLEKAEHATKSVGVGMETMSSVIQENEPSTGVLHDVGEAVAAKLEGAGRYLENQGLSGAGEDLTNLIRSNPIPSLLVGVGVGILLAHLMRRP